MNFVDNVDCFFDKKSYSHRDIKKLFINIVLYTFVLLQIKIINVFNFIVHAL